jgi:hypothetical protein
LLGCLGNPNTGNPNKNPGNPNKKSRNPNKKRIEFLCLDFWLLFKKYKFNFFFGFP